MHLIEFSLIFHLPMKILSKGTYIMNLRGRYHIVAVKLYYCPGLSCDHFVDVGEENIVLGIENSVMVPLRLFHDTYFATFTICVF